MNLKVDDLPEATGDILTGVDMEQVARLDNLLLRDDGLMRLQPAKFWQDVPDVDRRYWCQQRGRYGIVTAELVDWLREKLRLRTGLEIGAGCGDLGYRLGIPMTDSFQQVDDPLMSEYLARNGIPTIKPHPQVIREDAENAVRKRKPDVVIGSWITQKWREGDSTGNAFGPREDYILERCSTYIMIGNERVHGRKRLLEEPHETHKFPWLVSRAGDQSKNVIYVWNNPKPWR